jgi:hypothetical protein
VTIAATRSFPANSAICTSTGLSDLELCFKRQQTARLSTPRFDRGNAEPSLLGSFCAKKAILKRYCFSTLPTRSRLDYQSG